MTTTTETTRYGTATATAWGRLHQRLESRCAWEDHDGELPVVEGTVIRLSVDHLPGGQHPEPVWLWSSRAGTSGEEVDRTWQARPRPPARLEEPPPGHPHDVGKTVRRTEPKKITRRQAG